MNKIVCQSQGQYQNIIQLRHSVKQIILVKLYRNSDTIDIIFGFVWKYEGIYEIIICQTQWLESNFYQVYTWDQK